MKTWDNLLNLVGTYSAEWINHQVSLEDFLQAHLVYYKAYRIYPELVIELSQYLKRFPNTNSERDFKDIEAIKTLILSMDSIYLEMLKDFKLAYPRNAVIQGKRIALLRAEEHVLQAAYKFALKSDPIKNHYRIINILRDRKDDISCNVLNFLTSWESWEDLDDNQIMQVDYEENY